VGELDPQHITRFGAAPSARNLVGLAQRLDEAYRRLVAAGGVPSQDLSTIYRDIPDQDEGDHDGEY
jgi:hypothetical protein